MAKLFLHYQQLQLVICHAWCWSKVAFPKKILKVGDS